MDDNSLGAALLATSALLMLAVLLVHRRGLLSIRYLAGWMVVSGFLFGAGLLVLFVDFLPAGLLVLGALLSLSALLVQLSISVSGLQRQYRDLAESVAITLVHPPSKPNDVKDSTLTLEQSEEASDYRRVD